MWSWIVEVVLAALRHGKHGFLEDDPDLEGIDVEIPVDKKGAEVLYIPHPLELRDFPFAVMAVAVL